MTTNEEWASELLRDISSLKYYGKLTPQGISIRNVILQKLQEEYKRGYIDGGIELLNLYGTPRCEHLHHSKKHQHGAFENCPVVEKIAQLTKQEEQ